MPNASLCWPQYAFPPLAGIVDTPPACPGILP